MTLMPIALAAAVGGVIIGSLAPQIGIPAIMGTALGVCGAVGALVAGIHSSRRREQTADAARWARVFSALPRDDDELVSGGSVSGPLESRVPAAIRAYRERAEDLLVRNRVHLFERRRLTAALDRVPYGVVITDADDRLVVCNRVASAVLGVEASVCIGKLMPDVAPELEDAAAQANSTGRATLKAHGDDTEREYMVQRHVVASPDRTEQGKIYTLRDATQLQSSERAQSEFISQISHELKAPLNTIVAYVDALSDPDLLSEGERREYFNNLTGETERLADLIGNLLKLSRIELGNLSANLGFVKPGALVRKISESFRHQATEKQQTLTVRISDTLRPVYGDKDLLGVAVSNLLSNAIKYTPNGGRIEVNATEIGEDIIITVTDTGVGIPEELGQRVFERFVRSEQEHVVEAGGSGLGLSLVLEIVQLHHGEVTFTSTEDSGTQFQIRLPKKESGDQIQLAA